MLQRQNVHTDSYEIAYPQPQRLPAGIFGPVFAGCQAPIAGFFRRAIRRYAALPAMARNKRTVGRKPYPEGNDHGRNAVLILSNQLLRIAEE
ncbi:MAG TPA: hypothetical protein VGG94_02580, partial [Chthoniobacterales bacterium]